MKKFILLLLFITSAYAFDFDGLIDSDYFNETISGSDFDSNYSSIIKDCNVRNDSGLVFELYVDLNGSYLLNASLYDNFDNFISDFSSSFSDKNIEIVFDQDVIVNSGLNGPYVLDYILIKQSNETYFGNGCMSDYFAYYEFNESYWDEINEMFTEETTTTTVTTISTTTTITTSTTTTILKEKDSKKKKSFVRENKVIEWFFPSGDLEIKEKIKAVEDFQEDFEIIIEENEDYAFTGILLFFLVGLFFLFRILTFHDSDRL